MKILVTGVQGFVGKNLLEHLRQNKDVTLYSISRETNKHTALKYIRESDVVFHLAGVNRPVNQEDFITDNLTLTEFIVTELERKEAPYQFHYASSTQAALNSPYGLSKKAAEDFLFNSVKEGQVFIYRFPGIFGKWCKPYYNSVVATFCHNTAHDIPLEISDPSKILHLMYIDDVVKKMLDFSKAPFQKGKVLFADIRPVYEVSLDSLAKALNSFKLSRETLMIPSVDDDFVKKLYSTYLSYLPINKFSYNLNLRTDERGSLFELLKTTGSGQIFVSTTHPGITRGNHYHHLKTEKFCVIAGDGVIRFRKIGTSEIIEYKVSGIDPQVLDIPPGYTHNITNIGTSEMITLFWANEIFNPEQPDTFFEKV
ncbi:MAG: NAD-dependent epimerase/dehydratase family protein [Cyclobacteriaceae bacterium]